MISICLLFMINRSTLSLPIRPMMSSLPLGLTSMTEKIMGGMDVIMEERERIA